ncbi:uncharacterized protein LOC126318654 [Schistocerca gregaria]|uniref:uncharacterized protein LOC126318654 n=1 Tax=Schistocerca gregaria TaxID=7010 RepID=UPI00211DEC7A|nr:uncharacterized protein LOC126318654 [Schistocerca gregaria]
MEYMQSVSNSQDVLAEEEPFLKYQRLGNSVSEILVKKPVSYLAVHEKFIALGTQWGSIHVLDYDGTEIKQFSSHVASINDISIDIEGEHIASCSQDGSIAIYGLYTDNVARTDYRHPLLSVSIEPHYTKSSRRGFVVGGKSGKLILKASSWISKYDSLLHEGEGVIYCVRWQDSLIAWINEAGARIYDLTSKQIIAYVESPKDFPSDAYPSVVWRSANELIIGWASTVQVVQIKTVSTQISSLSSSKIIEIVAIFETSGYFVCGVAPYNQHFVVLVCGKADETGKETDDFSFPEVHVVTEDGMIICSDLLPMHDSSLYRAADYRLSYSAPVSGDDESQFFWIISPRDIILARPLNFNDHLNWLIERKDYEKALQLVQSASSAGEIDYQDFSLAEIGQRYLEHLLSSGRAQKAAEICPLVLGKDCDLWSYWIMRFEQRGQLSLLVSYIPTQGPVLNSMLYELILNDLLKTNLAAFHRTVAEWPKELYRVENIITIARDRISKIVCKLNVSDNLTVLSSDKANQGLTLAQADELNQDRKHLCEALTHLYIFQEQYDSALDLRIQLNESTFDLVSKYGFDKFTYLNQKILSMVQGNADKAIELLVANTNKIPVEQVVQQLQSERRLLLQYLHRLFENGSEESRPYHDLQIELYTEYDLPKLQRFLTESQTYDFNLALRVCSEKKLYRDMVFIYDRIGSSQEALTVLIDKIGDADATIDYMKKKNEKELWDEGIERCIDKPKFLSALLEKAVGTHISALKLIERIPPGMELSNLCGHLVKILNDQKMQKSLHEACRAVVNADCAALLAQLVNCRKKGRNIILKHEDAV